VRARRRISAAQRRIRVSGTNTFAITSLALFMTTLDNLVVTSAIPVIRRDLSASLDGLEWTVNAYTLTFAVFLLTGARSATVSAAAACSPPGSHSSRLPPLRPRSRRRLRHSMLPAPSKDLVAHSSRR
jgi:MFS family permease